MGLGGQANAGAAGQAGGTTLQGCATWALDTARGATSTATLTSGGLLLFRPGNATNTQTASDTGDDVALSQPGLTGDFDITVNFDQFQPGDADLIMGPEFDAGVYHHDPTTGRIYSATGTVGAGDAYLAVLVPNDSTPINSFVPVPGAATIVGAAGSIELARKAGIITASITINGVKNSNSSMTPYNDDLVFFIGIGLVGESQGPSDSSVRITSVKVDGGGGAVMSDTFDCTQ
jgi:hypothetical protein